MFERSVSNKLWDVCIWNCYVAWKKKGKKRRRGQDLQKALVLTFKRIYSCKFKSSGLMLSIIPCFHITNDKRGRGRGGDVFRTNGEHSKPLGILIRVRGAKNKQQLSIFSPRLVRRSRRRCSVSFVPSPFNCNVNSIVRTITAVTYVFYYRPRCTYLLLIKSAYLLLERFANINN